MSFRATLVAATLTLIAMQSAWGETPEQFIDINGLTVKLCPLGIDLTMEGKDEKDIPAPVCKAMVHNTLLGARGMWFQLVLQVKESTLLGHNDWRLATNEERRLVSQEFDKLRWPYAKGYTWDSTSYDPLFDFWNGHRQPTDMFVDSKSMDHYIHSDCQIPQLEDRSDPVMIVRDGKPNTLWDDNVKTALARKVEYTRQNNEFEERYKQRELQAQAAAKAKEAADKKYQQDLPRLRKAIKAGDQVSAYVYGRTSGVLVIATRGNLLLVQDNYGRQIWLQREAVYLPRPYFPQR